MGKEGLSFLSWDLRSLRDGLALLAVYKRGPSSSWMPGLLEREKVMFRQMDEFLQDLDKDERFILIGHNFHLSKDYRRLRGGSVPMWPSIGNHVAQRLPGEVYSIWMLYDHGRHGNISRKDFYEDVPSHPSRVERLFSRVGKCFVLPFHSQDEREQYLDVARNFVFNGGLARGVLKSVADAVFFMSEVSPIRKR